MGTQTFTPQQRMLLKLPSQAGLGSSRECLAPDSRPSECGMRRGQQGLFWGVFRDRGSTGGVVQEAVRLQGTGFQRGGEGGLADRTCRCGV